MERSRSEKKRLLAQGAVKKKEPDEMFTLLAATWDVTKAVKLVGDRAPSGEFPAAAAKSFLGVIHINEAHAKTVDLGKPVIVVETYADGKKGHLVIDGWHRVFRALKDGVENLSVHILSEQEARACAVTPAAKKIVTKPKEAA